MTKLKGIRQRGNSFMVDVTVDGVRKTKTFKSIEDALAFRQKYELTVKLGGDVAQIERDVARGTMTLVEAYHRTFEDYWKERAGEKTAVLNAGYALKFFNPKAKVADITEERIRDYKIDLETKTSNGATTIDRKLSALSKMLATAVECGKLGKKPSFKKFLSKLSKKQTRRKAYLSDAEEREFLDKVLVHAKKETNGKWKMFFDFVCFLIDTGARTNTEGLALPATDVQFQSNSILFWETKTGTPRSVPMTPRVKTIMELRVKQAKNNKLWYLLSKDSVRHYWDTIRAEMNWQDSKDHCPYLCRHTTASRLVSRGVSLPIVMQFMGHTQWETTLGYAHLAPEHLNVCAEVLSQNEEAFDGKVVNFNKDLTATKDKVAG